MVIDLIEPTNFRYIRVNSSTNRVHLHVPIIAGTEVSTDNTCKTDLELKAFFEQGALNELKSYKNTLEYHLILLEDNVHYLNNPHYIAKKSRLNQVHIYIESLLSIENQYRRIVDAFLKQPSNLYSIQLRPRHQDVYSKVINPVFSLDRKNDKHDFPLSTFYKTMHDVFQNLIIDRMDPHEQFIVDVLNSLPSNPSFETIQNALAAHLHVPEDFFKKQEVNYRLIEIDQLYINRLMGFDNNNNTTPHEYITALLGFCAPDLQNTFQGSPFYLCIPYDALQRAECFSILTQFFLGVVNVYCRAKGISEKNFGKILDNSPALSQNLVYIVAQTLTKNEEVESAIIAFLNFNKHEFKLINDLNTQDKDAINQKFETAYRTVTATKENPHMDDFMFLMPEASGEDNHFFTRHGLICTDFSNIVPKTNPNQSYYAQTRNEASINPKDFHMPCLISVEVSPNTLLKLNEEQWKKLPQKIKKACRALPVFKLRKFLDYVAKGKQTEADAFLRKSSNKQSLLNTPSILTDYSERRFDCTAYEYAYWAKDTHMCRMLESYMNYETKLIILEKVTEIERSGLRYQQREEIYQNPHYDMSFVLRSLTIPELHQLKMLVGQKIPKIQETTEDSYKALPFLSIEFEALKKILLECKSKYYFSFFFESPAKCILGKLKFDFNSLISALDYYAANYNKLRNYEREIAWMAVGMAQRDVPAHIANEYCRQDRPFIVTPTFNDATLPRLLKFINYDSSIHHTSNESTWFPLFHYDTHVGLGYSFAILASPIQGAWGVPRAMGPVPRERVHNDLETLCYLMESRTKELSQSRENLNTLFDIKSLSMLYY